MMELNFYIFEKDLFTVIEKVHRYLRNNGADYVDVIAADRRRSHPNLYRVTFRGTMRDTLQPTPEISEEDVEKMIGYKEHSDLGEPELIDRLKSSTIEEIIYYQPK
ncbi:MAG: hypothetical protein QMD14_02425 [Candidatus Aenigmarchaeota archaeon]|nr:hypothetical protein [Candidatus Aenigmarchaeota archaeon]